jgi:uncharacterized DUF497 family protein
MYIRDKSRLACELRFSGHSKERIGVRAGITSTKVREAYRDPGGVVYRLSSDRRALLGRSDDGAYLVLVLRLKKSCDWLITVRVMDDRERRRYRKGW